eukprot:COSAG01_NODE_54771_length_329_cov_22.756522_1_plen_95_part_01
MVSPTVNVLCARPDNTTTMVMLQHHVNIVCLVDSRTQSELSNADQYSALLVKTGRVRVPPQGLLSAPDVRLDSTTTTEIPLRLAKVARLANTRAL